MADALSANLQEDIVMPGIPIRKEGNNQSTNIRLAHVQPCTKQELLLVELKTTDTSFAAWQASIYEDLQNKIASTQSAVFLAEDLEDIADESLERGKYLNVQKMTASGLGALLKTPSVRSSAVASMPGSFTWPRKPATPSKMA